MTPPNEKRGRGELSFEAELSLQRLQPRLTQFWEFHDLPDGLIADFDKRLAQHWPRLFRLLLELYGDRYDFFYHVEQVLLTCAEGWLQRPDRLRELDAHRLNEPNWFQSERLVGGALYVDLFSENLSRLRELIGYFKKLGITYVHLMPLFAVRPGNNDGGYAISNYRSVDPRVGTIEDLKELATDLREAGIVLVWISFSITPLTITIGLNKHKLAIASTKISILYFRTGRSRSNMKRRCVKFSQPFGAEILPGMRRCKAGFGRRSTAFNGI